MSNNVDSANYIARCLESDARYIREDLPLGKYDAVEVYLGTLERNAQRLRAVLARVRKEAEAKS